MQSLLNKCLSMAERQRPMEILTATFSENVDNYIFVEAFKKLSVQEAIQGLSCFLGKVNLLPISEMTKVYEQSGKQN